MKEVLANAFVVPLAVNPSVLCIPLIISWVFPSEPPKINIKKNKQLKIVKKLGQKKVKRRRFKALDVRTETETAEKWGRIWAIQNIEKGSLITTTTSRKQSPPRTWPVHQESEQPTEVERLGEHPANPSNRSERLIWEDYVSRLSRLRRCGGINNNLLFDRRSQ